MIRPLYEVLTSGANTVYQLVVVGWRVAGEIFRLNYELVAAIFRTVQEFAEILIALTLMLSSAVCDILVHFLEFLHFTAAALWYYGEVLYDLMKPMTKTVLKSLMNFYGHVSSAADHLVDNIKIGLISLSQAVDAFFDNLLSPPPSKHRISVSAPAAPTGVAKLSGADDAENAREIPSIGKWICATLEAAQNDIGAMYESFMRNVNVNGSFSFTRGIHNMTLMPHFTYNACLATLLCSFAIVASSLLLKMMKSKGLTVPFLTTSSRADIEMMLRDPDIFSDTDGEEEEEEDVVDDEEVSDESEEEAGAPELAEDDENSSRGSSDAEEEEEEEEEELSVVNSDDDGDDETDEDTDGDDDINIQLPERRVTRSATRRSPSPLASASAPLSPQQLHHILETEKDKQRCVVCQDNPKNVLVLPCRHMCLCVDCAHEIANSRRRERKICPLCRTHMETVMNVYT